MNIKQNESKDNLAIGVTGILFSFAQVFLGGLNNITSLTIAMLVGIFCLILVFFRQQQASYQINWQNCATSFFFILMLSAVYFSSFLQTFPEKDGSLRAPFGIRSQVDNSRSLIEVVKLLGAGCAYLVGLIAVPNTSSRKKLIYFSTLLILTYTVWAIVTFKYLPRSIMGFGEKKLFEERLSASFSSANTAGTFFGIAFLTATGQILSAIEQVRSNPRRIGFWDDLLVALSIPILSLVTFGTALVLTQSRTAITATSISFVCLIVLESLARKWSWKLTVIGLIPWALVGALAITFAGGDAFLGRLGLLGSDAIVRLNIYREHANVIFSRILYGYGAGTFELINKHISTPNNYKYLWNVRSMHNVYLQWIESGGLAAFLLLSVTIFIPVSSLLFYNPLVIGFSTERRSIFCASVLVLLHGFTDFALENYSIVIFWAFLLGIGLSSSDRLITSETIASSRKRAGKS